MQPFSFVGYAFSYRKEPPAVADLVFGFVIDLARNLLSCDEAVRKGGTKQGLVGFELEGKKFGVIGAGAIGERVLKIAQAFGCETYAYNRSKKDAVSDSYREASFGVGAGKLRTVFKIVLPAAMPGILSGVILAIGRIVGETAALIYTAGTVAEVSKGLLSSGRTLAIHMYVLSSEGLYTNQAYATAVVLLIFVLIINFMASLVAKKFAAKD